MLRCYSPVFDPISPAFLIQRLLTFAMVILLCWVYAPATDFAYGRNSVEQSKTLTPQNTTSTAPTLKSSSIGVEAAIASGSVLSQQVSSQEWLGPLAAVALSPFFGIACLSGLATYGPESIQSGNALLSTHGPLNNPYLFWAMAVLTLLTSLPRFTKVSKPISLMCEKLEASSAIIILLVIRFSMNSANTEGVTTAMDNVSVDLLGAGVLQTSGSVLMSIAAAINVLVINSIKLFTEILVWLTPIPFVDGLLEVANKSLCLGLMAIYSYSPLLATALNLALLSVCFVLFLQVKRRLRSMRELMLKPFLAKLFRAARSSPQDWTGFLVSPWNSYPSKTAIHCRYDASTSSWILEYSGWLTRKSYQATLVAERCQAGLIADRIVFRVENFEIQLDVRKDIGLATIVRQQSKSDIAIA